MLPAIDPPALPPLVLAFRRGRFPASGFPASYGRKRSNIALLSLFPSALLPLFFVLVRCSFLPLAFALCLSFLPLAASASFSRCSSFLFRLLSIGHFLAAVRGVAYIANIFRLFPASWSYKKGCSVLPYLCATNTAKNDLLLLLLVCTAVL